LIDLLLLDRRQEKPDGRQARGIAGAHGALHVLGDPFFERHGSEKGRIASPLVWKIGAVRFSKASEAAAACAGACNDPSPPQRACACARPWAFRRTRGREARSEGPSFRLCA